MNLEQKMKPVSPKPSSSTSDSSKNGEEVSMSRKRHIKKKHKKRFRKNLQKLEANKMPRTEVDVQEALKSSVTNLNFVAQSLMETVKLLSSDFDYSTGKGTPNKGIWKAERLHEAGSEAIEKLQPILAELGELKKIRLVQKQVPLLTNNDDSNSSELDNGCLLKSEPTPKATTSKPEKKSQEGSFHFVDAFTNMFSIFKKPGTVDNSIITIETTDQDTDPENGSNAFDKGQTASTNQGLDDTVHCDQTAPETEVTKPIVEKVDDVLESESESEQAHSCITKELGQKSKTDHLNMSTTVRKRGGRVSKINDHEHLNLWVWNGHSVDKRDGKEFFNGITRGKEIVSVGDSAQFTSSNPRRPYFGYVNAFYEQHGEKKISVTWYYRPYDVTAKKKDVPTIEFPKFALFKSNHFDVNDIRTVEKKCTMLSVEDFREQYGSKFVGGKKSNVSNKDLPKDTYYVAGFWNPFTIKFGPLREPSVSLD